MAKLLHMKMIAVFATGICLIILCGYTTTYTGKTDTYYFTNDIRLANYIVLEKNGDSAKGTYYGVEINRDTALVYLEAAITGKIDSSHVSFTLDNFRFSYKPMYKNPGNKAYITDENKFPLVCMFHPSFFGEFITGDMLNLNRTYDIYDNRADDMLFFKISE